MSHKFVDFFVAAYKLIDNQHYVIHEGRSLLPPYTEELEAYIKFSMGCYKPLIHCKTDDITLYISMRIFREYLTPACAARF